MELDRRAFLSDSSRAVAGLGILSLGACCTSEDKSPVAHAPQKSRTKENSLFQISLAQWSFHVALGRGKTATMDNLEFAREASDLGFAVVDRDDNADAGGRIADDATGALRPYPNQAHQQRVPDEGVDHESKASPEDRIHGSPYGSQDSCQLRRPGVAEIAQGPPHGCPRRRRGRGAHRFARSSSSREPYPALGIFWDVRIDRGAWAVLASVRAKRIDEGVEHAQLFLGGCLARARERGLDSECRGPVTEGPDSGTLRDSRFWCSARGAA